MARPKTSHYPLGETQSARIRTPAGHALTELTLDNLLSGKLGPADIAISGEALRLQAEVAEGAGRSRLAENFLRGAELASVPQEELFETYELLRPGRAKDKQALLDLAARYRRDHGAPNIARLIEEAAEVYEARGLFRKRF